MVNVPKRHWRTGLLVLIAAIMAIPMEAFAQGQGGQPPQPKPPSRKVLRQLRQRFEREPTVREVQEAFGFRSPQTAREHLEALVDEGRLGKQKGKARGYRLPDGSGGAAALIPLLGRVPAGSLDTAVEDLEGYLPISPERSSGELFGLRVHGESMTGAGILPGDSVVVDVDDPDSGLDYHLPGTPSSGPAVYFYCSIDGPNAGTAAADIVVDSRYNYVGTVAAGGRALNRPGNPVPIRLSGVWKPSARRLRNSRGLPPAEKGGFSGKTEKSTFFQRFHCIYGSDFA